MTEDGKFVLPGENLGISEEFMPGNWAYEEDGNIFAAVSGKVALDMTDRKINITPDVSTPPVLKDEDIIIGSLWDVKSSLALLSIIRIKGKDRSMPGNIRGAIHISKAREGYVSEISKEFSVGDVVLAKVVDAKREPVELTTAGKDLGVIKASCSRCGGSLKPSKNDLKCNICKNVEPRNISSEYGTGEV